MTDALDFSAGVAASRSLDPPKAKRSRRSPLVSGSAAVTRAVAPTLTPATAPMSKPAELPGDVTLGPLNGSELAPLPPPTPPAPAPTPQGRVAPPPAKWWEGPAGTA